MSPASIPASARDRRHALRGAAEASHHNPGGETAMEFETILYEKADGVARITLNRPEAGHAINRTFGYEFMEAALRASTDPEVRCCLLTANGGMYGFGGDLKYFSTQMDQIEYRLTELTAVVHQAIQRFRHMEAPLIIAVNGMAAGGGFSLSLFGDVVLAARSARFTLAYTNAGLSPDASSSFFLPRLVGLRRAQELIFTNRVLSAEEALEWGLITRVVDDDALAGEAGALARWMASGPTRAYGAVKRLLARSFEQSLEVQLEEESRSIGAMAATADGREGLDAFLNKRKPVFRGE